MKLERGTVILVDLDPAIGQAENNLRPCILDSDTLAAIEERLRLLLGLPVAAAD